VEYGLLLLRIVVGVIFVGHGAQKLFGRFGGGGPEGTAQFFATIGYRRPRLLAVVAGLSEFGGGLLLIAGLLTPLAALLIATVMLNAIATVVFPKGFLGGYEFELTLLTVVVALAATGPGRISLDHAIGWADELSGIAWASLVLASAIVVSIVTTTLGRGSAELDEIPG
jgi:putative oxidoreductase